GDAWEPGMVPAQREVVDEDRRAVRGQGLQALAGLLAARGAPRGARWVGIWVQDRLVRAEHPRVHGPLHRVLLGDFIRPERVVVEQEEGGDDPRRALSGPPGIGVLRREDTIPLAEGDELPV